MTHESTVAWRRISHKCTKGLLLKGMSFLLVGKKKTEKEQENNKALPAHPHTMCAGTMPLLTPFLQEIIHHTGTPAGYGPLLCGNPAFDKLTRGTCKVWELAFVLCIWYGNKQSSHRKPTGSFMERRGSFRMRASD